MRAENRFWFLVLGSVAAVAAAPGKPMCEVRIKIEGRLVGADSVWLDLQDRRDPISLKSSLWGMYFKGAQVDTTLSLPAGRDYAFGGDFVPNGALRGLLVTIETPVNREHYTPEMDIKLSSTRRSQSYGIVSWFSLTSVCEVD